MLSERLDRVHVSRGRDADVRRHPP
jgi:hypothetical protein